MWSHDIKKKIHKEVQTITQGYFCLVLLNSQLFKENPWVFDSYFTQGQSKVKTSNQGQNYYRKYKVSGQNISARKLFKAKLWIKISECPPKLNCRFRSTELFLSQRLDFQSTMTHGINFFQNSGVSRFDILMGHFIKMSGRA